MKRMKKLFILPLLALTAVVLVSCKKNTPPTLSGVADATINQYSQFDALAGVTATDKEDGDLTSAIKVVTNTVDVAVVGNYQVKYEVVDKGGAKAEATRTVKVNAVSEDDFEAANYLSGVDFTKLKTEDRAILFAAAERYLLENVYAGVPLWRQASKVRFSERVQLFTEEYNGVLGFGTAQSTLTKDDSEVEMTQGVKGNANEYTWRSSFSTNPQTYNPWTTDDSATSDMTDYMNGGLYDFYFDDTKESFEILPSLAASEPVPVNPVEINGKIFAKVWQVTLKDDLKWTFHPNAPELEEGADVLDIEDYLWTWEYAMKNKWFRARSGGGDFIGKGIKGAADFIDGKISFDNVGVRKAEGKENTIEFEFIYEKDTFDFKYGLAGAIISPINKELFEVVGAANYGDVTKPENVASTGVYYIDTFESGQLIRFKKNENHPDANLYSFTGMQFRYIKDANAAYEEFRAGRLESGSIPASYMATDGNLPDVRTSESATTTRMVINGFGTNENKKAYEEKHGVTLSDFTPEPILGFVEMKRALFYGLDRQKMAVTVGKGYLPAHTYFSDTYFLDGGSGVGVRQSEVGQAIFDDFAGKSYGFVPGVAKSEFQKAVVKGIESGAYKKGTAANYTVITLELAWASSGNTSAEAMVTELKQQYETLLVDEVNFVKVEIDVKDVGHPFQYYNYGMKAGADLVIGGISGSLLNAPSFLDVFADDNRGGFTLDWGIDTSSVNIPVVYKNVNDVVVAEKWSFNALVAALNGKVYIRDGVEQKAFTSANDLVNAYLDMSGEVKVSEKDPSAYFEQVYGAKLADVVKDSGFESAEAKVIVTETGSHLLFIVGKQGNNYELLDRTSLITLPELAVSKHYENTRAGGYGAFILNSEKLTTDEAVKANELATAKGWATMEQVIAGLEVTGYEAKDLVIIGGLIELDNGNAKVNYDFLSVATKVNEYYVLVGTTEVVAAE